MSTDTGGFGERLAGLETGFEQMNERLGAIENRLDTIESRIDRVDGKIDSVNDGLNEKIDREIQNLRTDFRRWLLALFAGLSLVFTVVSIVVQIAL